MPSLLLHEWKVVLVIFLCSADLICPSCLNVFLILTCPRGLFKPLPGLAVAKMNAQACYPERCLSHNEMHFHKKIEFEPKDPFDLSVQGGE